MQNLPIDKFKTGDLVMSRRIGKMSLKERICVNGIMRTTGSRHTHDEPIVVLKNGVHVGNAALPYYQLIPISERIREFNEQKRVFAVFRWHKFLEEHKNTEFYERFQECVSASIRTMAELRIPYDVKAIDRILVTRIVYNLLARNLHLKNIEHNVYCTEGNVVVMRVGNVDIMVSLGHQEFPSPIHMERLWCDGLYVMIADYGLKKYLVRR